MIVKPKAFSLRLRYDSKVLLVIIELFHFFK